MLYTGHCHCGAITYQVSDPIVKSSACDCPGCTRATGTLSAPFVTFKQANYAITAGEPATYRAPSGEMCDKYGTWHFCRDCGTQLYWLPNDGEDIDVFAGSLDDRSLFKPEG